MKIFMAGIIGNNDDELDEYKTIFNIFITRLYLDKALMPYAKKRNKKN